MLDAVNQRRGSLELLKLSKLEADTKLDAGVVESGKVPEFNKQSALRDLAALEIAAAGLTVTGKTEAAIKAVHYNAWAKFGKKDFQPVVNAFKDLLSQFRCDACQSWLYVSPKGASPEALRCSCAAVSLNLKGKPK